jgi:ferrochelatase
LKIVDLARACKGEIKNSPFVDSVDIGYTSPDKVKQGDFFVGNSKQDIKESIKNGAYAIITENSHESYDDEIAWIYVEDIKKALLSILRYKLSLKSKVIYTNFICFSILKQIVDCKKVFFLKSIEDDFTRIYSMDIEYVFTYDQEYANTLDSDHFKSKDKLSKPHIIKQNPLYCTFCYDDGYFEDIKIVSVFFNDLLCGLDLAKHFDMDLSVDKLDYFYPVEITFIDQNLNAVDFGKSEKVFCAVLDDRYQSDFLKSLKEFYSWNRFCILDNISDIEDIKKSHFIISKKRLCIIKNQISLASIKLHNDEKFLF